MALDGQMLVSVAVNRPKGTSRFLLRPRSVLGDYASR